MRYLVTGATGFIGSHMVRALCEEGRRVRAFVRESSDLALLGGLQVELAYGDLQNLATVQQALKGVDVVIHCAGAVGDWGKPSYFHRTNVFGTRNLLEACRDSGIKRVIVISSLSVYGIKHHEGTNENAPFHKTGDHYSDSKIEAEEMMARFLREGNPPLTILRPGFIYGPGDRKFIPQLLETLRAGRFSFIGSGNNVLNIAYIDDVVQAAILAAGNAGAAGRTYNITDGTRTTARHFVSALAELAGLEVPSRHIPYRVAYVVCLLSEAVAGLFYPRRKPRLTRAALKFLGVSRYFDITRASKELGYEPRIKYQEGLRLTWEHLNRQATAGAPPETVSPASQVHQKRRSAMKRIADLARKYLARHADPYNRLLHLIGVPVVFYGIGIAFTGKYALSVSFIAVGYFFQYVGHRIEGNRMGEVELIVRISRKVRA